MMGSKNQGQSTVEYVLMVGLAIFTVSSLGLYFAPEGSPFDRALDTVKEQIISRVAGGKLVSHYKKDALPAGQSGGPGAFPSGSGGSEGQTAHLGGSGSAGGGMGGNAGATDISQAQGGGSAPQFLGQSGSGGRGQGALGEAQSGEDMGTGSTVGGGSVRAKEKKTDSGSFESQKEESPEAQKEEKGASGSAYLYGEEKASEKTGVSMNWMKYFLILLILILIFYLLFQVFSASKQGRKR